MAVKLKDIAKELNLPVSTISRVANNKDRVDPATRKRVLRALKSHDYKPNEVARSLRLKAAKTIAIVVLDIANNYYASLIKGAQSVCGERGYSAMVFNSDNNRSIEREILEQLPHLQIAGLILACADDTMDAVEQYSGLGLETVYVDNIPDLSGECAAVSIDNVAAARMLTERLLGRGYADIGFIAGVLEMSSGADRLTGFRKAMKEAGVPVNEDWIAIGDFTRESGYHAMKKLLEGKDRPRAVVSCNNHMTYGAIRAINEAGLSIPGDIAVAAFDVVDETGLISPTITSINQPAGEIGQRAARMILDRLSGEEEGERGRLYLDPLFVPGNSW